MRVSESSNRVPNKRPFRSLSLILPAKLPVSLSQRLCELFLFARLSPSLTFILRLSWVSLVTFEFRHELEGTFCLNETPTI